MLRTPRSAGAIGVITVDGPGALARLASTWSGAALRQTHGGRLKLGHLRRGEEAFDEVLVAVQDAAAGETGQPQADVNTHGGPVAARLALEALADAGFRIAAERDLWLRALRAGRVDRLEIEAREALAQCVTPEQVAALSGRADALRRGLRALGERPGTAERAEVRRWLRDGERLQALLKTHRIVLAGPVNSGKSTLVNRLSGESRVLVSATPGTTRDRVEVPAAIAGLDVTLVDAAGARVGGDAVEQLGQRRARQAAAGADLLLAVADGTARADLRWLQDLPPVPRLVVVNKADCGRVDAVASAVRQTSDDEPVVISAQTGAHVPALIQAVAAALAPSGEPSRQAAAPFTERQCALLQAMVESRAAEPWRTRLLYEIPPDPAEREGSL